MFFSSQLVDLFSYELPLGNNTGISYDDTTSNPSNPFHVNNSLYTSNSIIVYNFHNLMFQERFFFFCTELANQKFNFTLNSISELYPNASWLEREVSELHGSVFSNKKDLRNLMLQYGDTSTPFRKSYPSIGVKEFFYDSINDSLTFIPLSVQV
jgi:NADH:ubiquinone oxidoreductase subunit C